MGGIGIFYGGADAAAVHHQTPCAWKHQDEDTLIRIWAYNQGVTESRSQPAVWCLGIAAIVASRCETAEDRPDLAMRPAGLPLAGRFRPYSLALRLAVYLPVRMCADRDRLFAEYGNARKTVQELSHKLRHAAKGPGGEFDGIWDEMNQARKTLESARDEFMRHVETHKCD